jgi:hypothetical protein
MRALLWFALILAPTWSWSHPVGFKDSWGIMSFNSEKMNELTINHSITSRMAPAVTYRRVDQFELTAARLNLLLKRWNLERSQGNIYVSAGYGLGKERSERGGVPIFETVADWEDRRVYTLVEHSYMRTLRGTDRDWHYGKARLGFAPFLGEFRDLNVWLIGEWESLPGEAVEFKQLLRFYYRNALWEIGMGFNGSVIFNYMIHL